MKFKPIKDFVKKYYKQLSVILLVALSAFIIVSQVDFKSPDQVAHEAKPFVDLLEGQVSPVDETTQVGSNSQQTQEPTYISDTQRPPQQNNQNIFFQPGGTSSTVTVPSNIPNESEPTEVSGSTVSPEQEDQSSRVPVEGTGTSIPEETKTSSSQTSSYKEDNTSSLGTSSDTSSDTSPVEHKPLFGGDTTTRPSETTSSSSSSTTITPQSSSEVTRKKLLDYIGGAWQHTGNRYIPLIDQKVDTSKKITVYVTVECLSILEEGVACNDESAWKYVPKDGYIVPRSKVTCHQGENVWDAVARTLNANAIDYAYTGDPPFTHGVESISTVYGTCYLYRCNHLEAGDSSQGIAGPFGNTMSGWTYTVNGIYPGLGMNGTVLKDGDEITLKYYTGYSNFVLDVEGNF